MPKKYQKNEPYQLIISNLLLVMYQILKLLEYFLKDSQ